MQGVVKWFDPRKGYGFIISEQGEEFFVHYTGIVSDSFKTLNEGERVTFDLEEGAKGRQATRVRVTE